jgi:hypothetical protein
MSLPNVAKEKEAKETKEAMEDPEQQSALSRTITQHFQ